MTVDFLRERITQLRLQKGISEYKMSYDLGHSRGYINNISSGKTLPSMAEFFAICDYFEITPVQFFQSEVQNPKMLQTLMEELAHMNESDLRLLQSLIQRLNQDNGHTDAPE